MMSDIDMMERSPDRFEYVDNPLEADTHAIKITSGSYTGVTYMYGRVAMKDDVNPPTLSFNYHLIDDCDNCYGRLDGNQDFVNTIGDILYNILEFNLEEGKAKIGHIRTDTDTRS